MVDINSAIDHHLEQKMEHEKRKKKVVYMKFLYLKNVQLGNEKSQLNLKSIFSKKKNLIFLLGLWHICRIETREKRKKKLRLIELNNQFGMKKLF